MYCEQRQRSLAADIEAWPDSDTGMQLLADALRSVVENTSGPAGAHIRELISKREQAAARQTAAIIQAELDRFSMALLVKGHLSQKQYLRSYAPYHWLYI